MMLGQPVGDVGVDFANRPRRVVADPAEDGHRRLGPERRTPRAHRVQHAPQAEQVGAGIDGVSLRLFGRHVLRRAGHFAGAGHADVIHGPGEAEVGDLHPLDAVLQQDVRRFDVAVDETLLVGRRQSRRDLPADAEDLFQFQRPLTVDLFLQRLAVDELHHQIREASVVRPARFLRRHRW